MTVKKEWCRGWRCRRFSLGIRLYGFWFCRSQWEGVFLYRGWAELSWCVRYHY